MITTKLSYQSSSLDFIFHVLKYVVLTYNFVKRFAI